MSKRLGRVLAATLGAVAAFEHLWLLYYAVAAYIDQRQHPSCMPFGYVAALVLGVAVTTSIVSAWSLFLRSEEAVLALRERLLWVSGAAVIAPWTAVVLSFPGWLLGPAGWFAAPLIGAAAPYVLIGFSACLPDDQA
jgi:hypothetical protein